MHEPRNHGGPEGRLDWDVDLEPPGPSVLGKTLANILAIVAATLAAAWLFGQIDLDSFTSASRSPAGHGELVKEVRQHPHSPYPRAHAAPTGRADLTVPADARGYFVLMAAVAGTETRFLIDTGASVVVLTREDAAAAGLQPDMLDYTVRLKTANGEIAAAPVLLREIAIGNMRMPDVEAVVVRTPLDISLLGGSFLSRLAGYEVRPDALTLRW